VTIYTAWDSTFAICDLSLFQGSDQSNSSRTKKFTAVNMQKGGESKYAFVHGKAYFVVNISLIQPYSRWRVNSTLLRLV